MLGMLILIGADGGPQFMAHGSRLGSMAHGSWASEAACWLDGWLAGLLAGCLAGWMTGQEDSCHRTPTIRFVQQNTSHKFRATANHP